ncbi:phosphatidylinositol 4,5-bisphosphate 3-kinase catalytic subunit alpha isoform-like isoform X2 [Portunus trituberculatus]|uniref:phosphatidylinositol 4,5-bisphosphate 3-kinase catalytic subunit alpha isoform-like isoform X2 n=1 Tax=Portunus trituberculatus TaxID=210409 RepID=UPI001E1D0BAC|nr:phosphatidylinositol 4,5-bisphosphate 3-kinase catalytic subunit alpha isoform-like isoform X2 [Portunus trituberculatus]
MGEPPGLTDEEREINKHISTILGCSVYTLYQCEDEEVQAFRKGAVGVVREAVRVRQQCGAPSLATYHHPPQLHATATLPTAVTRKLNDGYLTITLRKVTTTTTTTTLRVPWDIYPEGVVAWALRRLPPAASPPPSPPSSPYTQSSPPYVLRVNKSQEYLLAAKPITQYKTIRSLITQGRTPDLSLVAKKDFYASFHPVLFKDPSYTTTTTTTVTPATPAAPAPPTVSLWHPSLEGRLKVHVLKARGVGVKEGQKVFVCAGVYHGSEGLCTTQETCRSEVGGQGGAGLREWLQFDLPIQELPRGSRLCLALWCERASPERRRIWERSEEAMVGWGNINLFDFRGRLVHGRVCVRLQAPPRPPTTGYTPSDTQDPSPITQETPLTTASLAEMAQRDPLTPLPAGVREGVWGARQGCREVPDSLPCLVEAVKWASRDQVSQLYLLMKSWPPLSPEAALELLAGPSADPVVRCLATKHLDRALSDDALMQYMLQLVQSLKHEPHLESPLVCVLLRRALTNATLGHTLFWHLKAECGVWVRGEGVLAVVEAYCRGLGVAGAAGLARQVTAVSTMASLAHCIREGADGGKERLKEAEFSHPLQHLPSPLHPGITLGRLRVSECRVIESARCPLLLAWDAPSDSTPHPPAIIFKCGDDLRQDMLCLQILTLMARLWSEEGLELPLVPYRCQATTRDQGLIEVVPGAATVYGIQRVSTLGAIQVDSSQLYKWIKEKNCTESKLQQAIDNFTKSCAAYCVATFVLGIGDRHPSNIMVNRDGMIFHIDFGHILGNFKKKFGIPRERAPFVLTSDFLLVIAKGAENPKDSQEFQKFQQLCGKAYLALRHHYRLLAVLFRHLLNTGMPEVQSVADVAYLRKTLAVGVSEEEALRYFQNRFHEAYDGAWTTKLDWFFHCVRHR